MAFVVAVKKNLYWLVGILFAIIVVVFLEGSLIVTTKFLGVTKATLLRVSFTIPLSWIVIYLATKSNSNIYFRTWLAKKEANLSKRARTVVNGGKVIAVLNAALFLGPIIASILMLMIGIEIKRIYLYAVGCALLCAWAWCAFYAGVFWGLGKIF